MQLFAGFGAAVLQSAARALTPVGGALTPVLYNTAVRA